jgi:hypothetical protein
MRVIEGWRKEAIKANREIERVVLAYEVGRDGSLGAPRDSSLVPIDISCETRLSPALYLLSENGTFGGAER